LKKLDDITKEIELLRIELIEAGLRYGLNAPETLYLSQKLDSLLNRLIIV
jgi:hypothetical protein